LERKKAFGNFTFSYFESGIWITIIIRFLSMFAFATYGPFFMLYLNQTRGLTMTVAGMVVAFSAFPYAISQILGGVVTDRFGRKRSMLFFFGLDIVFNIALTVTIAASVSVWLITAIYVVGGIVTGLKQPAITAVLADLAPKDKLTEAYGLAQILANVGWIIGPLLGGYMFSSVSYAYLFAIAVLMSILCFILTLARLKDSFTGIKENVNIRSAFSIKADKSLLTYVFLNLLVFIVYTQIVNTYSVFAVNVLGFTTTQYGLLLTINATLAVLFQYPVTRAVDGWLGDKNALVLGSFLFGLGYLSLSWISSFSWSITAIAIITAGELLFVPSAFSIVGRLASPDQRGRYMGLLGAGSGLGIAIGPLLGGVLFDVSHGASLFMWGIIASFTFVAALGFLRWFATYKNRLV
jgi:MFS family permease